MRLDDPDPAAVSDEMRVFVDRVRDDAGLDNASEAEVLARATLARLGEQISSGETDTLAAHLPRELADELTASRHGQAQGFDKDTFVDQVSAQVHVVDADEVERRVRSVLSTVRAWAPDGPIESALAQLPPPLAALFA